METYFSMSGLCFLNFIVKAYFYILLRETKRGTDYFIINDILISFNTATVYVFVIYTTSHFTAYFFINIFF